MAQESKDERRCPGERAPISEAICAARQERRYAKCAECEYHDRRRAEQEGTWPPEAAHVFKAYDIRGIYPTELNEKLALAIGASTARYLGARTLAVGRDMRTSSVALSEAAMKGIMLTGCDVLDLGLCSTDANYFATGYYGVDGGIQTTASHNPPQYNGFKISRKDAVPVGMGSGLESIRNLALGPPLRPAVRPGKLEKKDVVNDFAQHVLGFARNVPRLKVVIDAGNGMAGRMLPPILERLPIQAKALYFQLDGTFPNHEPNPLKPENLKDLQREVRTSGAALGAAFDGDGDRCVFVDENGTIVPCDLITAVIARWLLREHGKATIVYDVRSSRVVAEEIRANGGIPCRERVGHAFIKATMRKRGALFGGELSGHFYFRDNYYADSGVIALVMVLNVLGTEKKKLSEIIKPLRRYVSTGEINYQVEDKEGRIKALAAAFKGGRIDYKDGITVEFDDWWFNVRPSNTEPVLRLNLEAKNKRQMQLRRKEVEKVILGKAK